MSHCELVLGISDCAVGRRKTFFRVHLTFVVVKCLFSYVSLLRLNEKILIKQTQIQLERKDLIELNQIRFVKKSDDASFIVVFVSPYLTHGRLCLRS